MRLLNVHSLQFQEFHAGGVPKYAIASHRWSLSQEITYKDVLKGRNTDKAGYSKVVQFAGFVRAHIPAVEWLWIDTACVDSKSSQEVSEAVNRMFSWYRNAEICLAYLVDVSTTDEDAFVQSEWFQRGWCLQELLAPRTVVFLTRDWDVVGHKGGQEGIKDDIAFDLGPVLDTAISLRTSIPEGVLRSYELSQKLSVSQKLVWMSGRQTTREEDMSYSLLGLLDVAMPTIYGEGGDKARRRLLREIAESSNDPLEAMSSSRPVDVPPPPPDLKVVQRRLLDSLRFPGFDSRRDQVRVAYHGTYRWTLLSDQTTEATWDNLLNWLSDPAPRHNIYWISSKPGAGKSSLIRLLDEELLPQSHMQPWSPDMGVLKLHFYFWNPGTDLQRNMAGLMRTLLYQLYDSMPELLTNTVPDRKMMIAQSPADQEITWTEHELRACLRAALDAASSSVKLLFLIDGLDEIDGDEDTRDDLVDLMRELGRKQNSKLILSSRRWTVFQDAFGMCPQLHLEDLNSRDIEIFVRGQLREHYRFQQMQTYESTVAERLVLDVVRKAEGVFLWARLVMKALVRGLRDGDSEQMLQDKLLGMPGDLNQYFGSLVDSIEPHHRWEACVLLQLASHKNDVSLFRELCRHLTDGDFAVRVILDHHDTEAKAVAWFQACMEEMPARLRLKDGKLLVDCLRKFPSSETFLKRLLHCGIPYPSAIAHTVCQETGPEDCSLLVWALLAEPRIPTKTIMLLIKEKYDAVDLSYATPKTHVSAALASLLDADRLPILKTLLATDRNRVIDYEVPESTLVRLSRNGRQDDEDADSVGPQDLRTAAFFLGNFDAFGLLDDGHSYRDEGLLHTAAFLALPKFVERLLHTHDPNLRLEEFDYLIPLMIAIDTTIPSSWGKVANDEEDFATRRKKTIQLLARKTDMSIQGHHRRTALHYAFYQGVETTTILLDALDLRSDPRRWETFSITDKDGKKYKPHKYVNELLISAEEKRQLCNCLKKANMGPGWGLFHGAFGS